MDGFPETGGFRARLRRRQRKLEKLRGTYHQRGHLEYPVFRPFLVLCCTNADFCVQGLIFQRFSSSTFFPLHHSWFLWFFKTSAPFLQNWTHFSENFKRDRRFWHFCQIVTEFLQDFTEFQWFWPEWCQNENISDKSEKICWKYSKIH